MQVCPVHIILKNANKPLRACTTSSCCTAVLLCCVVVLLFVQVCQVHSIPKHENNGFEGLHYQQLLSSSLQ
jgi:hypothetical protein